jgi:riboflavin synthase
MFTGIVEETGEALSFERGEQSWVLRVRAASVAGGLALGESVAVNGCCLTAVSVDGPVVAFDVLEETRRLTNLRLVEPGSPVNLERSLRADGRFGGHFVTGHIDGPGRILALEARGKDHYLRILGPAGSGRLQVMKGSVAVDGISLTIAEVDADAFAVWIIPHTLERTNLRARSVGDSVNLEFDLLGKYVAKLMDARAGGPA